MKHVETLQPMAFLTLTFHGDSMLLSRAVKCLPGADKAYTLDSKQLVVAVNSPSLLTLLCLMLSISNACVKSNTDVTHPRYHESA